MFSSLINRLNQSGTRRATFTILATGLAGTLVATQLTGSQWALLLTLSAIAATLAVTTLDARQSRIMLHDLRWRLGKVDRRVDALGALPPQTTQLGRRITQLERELSQTRSLLAVGLHDQARSAAVPAGKLLPPELIPVAALRLCDRGDALEAHALVTATRTLSNLSVGALRRLRNELQLRGYLTKALEVARAVEKLGGEERDVLVRRRIQADIAVLSGEFTPTIRTNGASFTSRPGRVLHLVGRSLPQDQVGYTIRTHYTAIAQRAAGLDPHVATHMGIANDGDDYSSDELDGITYHRIPGPSRGQERFDHWLRTHVQRVANLVRIVRPAVLHAASDFINALTARIVGTSYGIPVVYESRGFWEETWLSRKAQEFAWDIERLEAEYGLPDEYIWRRELENRMRLAADRVVTLADVMADRIEAGGVSRDRIAVVPNGVAADAFPVLSRDHELAAELGINEHTTVVGYISSLVEYEGVDTLIDAYATLRKSSPTPVALLIVGDGPIRDRLVRQVETLGLDDVRLTGRVPHEKVLAYYSLIDIFVVPRRPVEVCHLVTPLKPFEAFATGRTVVLSNVRALAAIAEQSGAAELFEAGNAPALADVLLALLNDPVRRKALADAGAAWVRAERTWSANALSYVRLYEELGAVPFGELRIPRLSAHTIDVARLRRYLAERGPVAFEHIAPGDAGNGADRIMTIGWKLHTHPLVTLDLPLDWATLCMSNRSWNFHFHAWDFMAPVLNAYSRTKERRYLDWCVDRAASWASFFNEGDGRGTMAWYDMALGLRGHRLAYLVEQAVLNDARPEAIPDLLACVVRHQQEYFSDQAFNPRSNHGVYTALGELALARRLGALPGMDVLARQGAERLAHMARSQFAADGGHTEHSPDYHRMLLDSFRGALDSGLIVDDDLRERLTLSEQILDWMVQPNGELVQVGDSPARKMKSLAARRVMSAVPAHPHQPAGSRQLLVLPDTGYAIIRSPDATQPGDGEPAGYLFLAAGFHSQTHKHADDLTITWFDRGSEILIDAGRYGYVNLLPADSPLRQQGFFYAAPERQYVESTRAHNTVEVDALDHVRRGRTPYGSAISGADEQGGYFLLTAEVDHGHWRHHRKIVLRPGCWLYVTDSVHSGDGHAHDFRTWWNLPGEASLSPSGENGVQVELPCSGTLWIVEFGGSELIAPVTAQRDPLRGWRSKQDLQLTPTWSIGHERLRSRSHVFRTFFSFGAECPADVPLHPFIEASEP
jgi:glycosyltransferase involved in cell wall biosynthesis